MTRGEAIGSVQVALPGGALDPDDRRLLDDLARHIAVAAHTEQLTEDLVASRGTSWRRGRRSVDTSAAVDVAASRIVSEALANVARHSDAADCQVELRRTDGALHIQVRDDGRGFGQATGAGLGLSSLRERAAEVGGDCTITSTPVGTTVRARLPVTR